MSIRYRIKKRPALKARIGGWGEQRRVTREVLVPIGFKIERRAKRLAPVDSGRLKSSLGTAWQGHRARVTSPAEPSDAIPTPTRDVVHVGSAVNYAAAVHERHKTKGKFLKRAVDMVKGDIGRVARAFRSGR